MEKDVFSILVNGRFVYFYLLSTQLMVLTHCYLLNVFLGVIFSFFYIQCDVNRLKGYSCLKGNVGVYVFAQKWLEYFITSQKYACTNQFSNLLTITCECGNVAHFILEKKPLLFSKSVKFILFERFTFVDAKIFLL